MEWLVALLVVGVMSWFVGFVVGSWIGYEKGQEDQRDFERWISGWRSE